MCKTFCMVHQVLCNAALRACSSIDPAHSLTRISRMRKATPPAPEQRLETVWFMATLEVELLGRGMEVAAEMELLKDLPCHDRANFSKFNQSSWKVGSLLLHARVCLSLSLLAAYRNWSLSLSTHTSTQTHSRPYISLKNGTENRAIGNS